MDILFINGSPNKNGNTAALAKKLLDGREYETLDLVDYKVYSYGQNFADAVFPVPGSSAHRADAEIRGIHHEPFRRTVWNELHGYGNRHRRGAEAGFQVGQMMIDR